MALTKKVLVTMTMLESHEVILNRARLAVQTTPYLIIVTGESGAGKTTWCQELIEVACRHGLTVGGLISPAVFIGKEKTAIDLTNLFSGEQRRMAKRRTENSPDPTGIVTPRWQFDAEVVAWGDSVLGQKQPCEMLVIDEIGILELERGQGFLHGLSLLDERAFQIACVVVRRSLLDIAIQRWNPEQTLIIEKSTAPHRQGIDR